MTVKPEFLNPTKVAFKNEYIKQTDIFRYTEAKATRHQQTRATRNLEGNLQTKGKLYQIELWIYTKGQRRLKIVTLWVDMIFFLSCKSL